MPANLENSAVTTGLERPIFLPIPKKSNAKECSNYHTTALISHTSKVMLKILQHHSSKASILQCPAFFVVQLSHPYVTTGKSIDLTRWTFVGKVMSLLFNMLSRFVIVFLPRSKHLLISWLQSSASALILEPHPTPKKKSVSLFHFFPIYLPWRDRVGCHDLHFLNAEF